MTTNDDVRIERIDSQTNCGEVQTFTATEAKIAAIWGELLHRPIQYADANFYEVGGDSLKMLIVVARVNDELHVELPATSLAETPTLRSFCELIDKAVRPEMLGAKQCDVAALNEDDCGYI